MSPPTTHTVHVLSVMTGLGDEIASRLPGTKVINVRNDVGFDGNIYERFFRQLTDEELESLADAEILVIDFPPMVHAVQRKGLGFLAKLRWMQSTSVGVDTVLKAIASEPPFLITRSTEDVSGRLMAEHVVGQILCYERRWLPTYLKQVNKDYKEWLQFREYRGLAQLTVGVMGVGNIGLTIAKTLKGFGCRVHGLARVTRDPASEVFGVDKLWYRREGLPGFLEECDYVVNTLPSTPATKFMLGGDVLSRAIKRPVLINVGRGDVISEADLLKALGQGWISGALLDCMEKEPPSNDSPLWTHPRVAMTPHMSTIANAAFKAESLARSFSANFPKFLEGQPLDGLVDWKAGY